MGFSVAIQLFSVRDDMNNDFEGTIKKMKEIGYDGVEFAGLYGRTAKEVKEICDEVGIVPLAAHISFEEMLNDPNVFKTYAEIGCKYVVIPYLTPEYYPGNEKFKDLISGSKTLGAKANEFGMKLAYHNHEIEFIKLDGEYALDVLYNEVSSDLLETELDVCWINVAGENPADYVRKYSGRVNILHIKDFAGKLNDNTYAFVGMDEDEKKKESQKFEFRPIGYGLQDFTEILNAAEEAGTKWLIVEQDEPSLDKSPIECAKLSIDYLKSL